MRLALVVQRYGLEVNGGAEVECRLLAERLSRHMSVEVLTTCAVDYRTWGNHYPPGLEVINGVPVRRFPVDRERKMAEFDRFTGEILGRPRTFADEMRWMELQGPMCSGLLSHLGTHESWYDLFFFMTFLYASTFLGLQMVPHKSMLLAMAHDDPWIRLNIFRGFFHLPRAFVFNTPEEQQLIHRLFRNEYIPGRILSSGIDTTALAAITADSSADVLKQETRIREEDEFIIFVGRVDPSKGCDQLFEYFLRYKSETGSPVKLVLVGNPTMSIPEHPDIVPLGFLREDPYPWMARAHTLVLPSVFESLSLVALESMALSVPVLVNGRCDVARGHCRRSNGGLYYYSYEEFAAALSILLTHPELRAQLGRQGQAYVRQDYAWEIMETRFVEWINSVAEYCAQTRRGVPNVEPGVNLTDHDLKQIGGTTQGVTADSPRVFSTGARL
jgi:glycosyltransferase involved in cell wall biosynthesis